MLNEKFYKDLKVDFTVEIGRGMKSIEDILTWRKGGTVWLEDSEVNKLSIYINDKHFGYGSILRKPDGQMDLLVDEKKMGVDVFGNSKSNDM